MTATVVSSRAKKALDEYFEAHGIPGELVCPADVVLGLLRLGFREEAEAAMGKPIEVCPPCVPPWPPLPVRKKILAGAVCRVGENPFRQGTKAHAAFRKIKQGMTRDEVIEAGVTYQQVYKWTKAGYMEIKK